MTAEARNLHYLNKSIVRIGEHVESLKERVTSLKQKPTEKQRLLMQVDADWGAGTDEDDVVRNPLFIR